MRPRKSIACTEVRCERGRAFGRIRRTLFTRAPGFAPAHAVAGAVEARAGIARERIGDEALGGERGPPQVAARHADAAQQQLAGHAHRHRPQRRVHHVARRSGQRHADGHAPVHRPRVDRQRGDTTVASVGP